LNYREIEPKIKTKAYVRGRRESQYPNTRSISRKIENLDAWWEYGKLEKRQKIRRATLKKERVFNERKRAEKENWNNQELRGQEHDEESMMELEPGAEVMKCSLNSKCPENIDDSQEVS
jgi:hypothetical protein